MKRRKPGQKEQEFNLIYDFWFQYVSKTLEPSVNDFACDFLGISKTALGRIRKGIMPQKEIEIINSNTLHPQTFKELFKYDVDKYVKSIKMPKEFKNKPDFLELIMPEADYFLFEICPKLRQFRSTIFSVKNKYYGFPTLSELKQQGYFYPATVACDGVSFECLELMEKLQYNYKY